MKTGIKPGPYVIYCNVLGGRLFLSSVSNGCIYEVDPQFGSTPAVYGTKGCVDTGKLLGPSKIYADDVGNALWVCDFGNNRFQILKPGTKCKCPMERECWLLIRTCVCIKQPQAACVDDDGYIWVAEKEGALYKFTYGTAAN